MKIDDKRRLIIVDIDDTICQKFQERDYGDTELMHKDTPITNVIYYISNLIGQSADRPDTYKVLFLTARTLKQENETYNWLSAYVSHYINFSRDDLVLVGNGDYRDNLKQKEEYLRYLEKNNPGILERSLAFEDNAGIAEMMESLNIKVHKVNKVVSYDIVTPTPKKNISGV